MSYFNLGVDFLLDPVSHRVVKIVLHSNIPGEVGFGRYGRSGWVIEGGKAETGRAWDEKVHSKAARSKAKVLTSVGRRHRPSSPDSTPALHLPSLLPRPPRTYTPPHPPPPLPPHLPRLPSQQRRPTPRLPENPKKVPLRLRPTSSPRTYRLLLLRRKSRSLRLECKESRRRARRRSSYRWSWTGRQTRPMKV